MSKFVKFIDIVFENCEYVRIPFSFLGVFYIGRISTKVERTASNAIEKHKIAKKVFIEIFAEVDDETLNSCKEGNITMSIINRIVSYSDITQIKVYYEDGSEEQYLVPYKVKDSMNYGPNVYQKNYISKLGHLYLAIGKKAKLESFLSDEDINGTDAKVRHDILLSCNGIDIEQAKG